MSLVYMGKMLCALKARFHNFFYLRKATVASVSNIIKGSGTHCGGSCADVSWQFSFTQPTHVLMLMTPFIKCKYINCISIKYV